MAIPESLIIHDCAIGQDGGSIALRASDDAGYARNIKLVKPAFIDPDTGLGEIPGRLYLDGNLVPVRSELETKLLGLLREASLPWCFPMVPDDMGQCTAELIRFVESDEYALFDEHIEQAADPTAYDVWLVWGEGGRKQVLVRLAKILGISVESATELMNAGGQIARGISAREVSIMQRQYAAEQLVIHVEPPLRAS